MLPALSPGAEGRLRLNVFGGRRDNRAPWASGVLTARATEPRLEGIHHRGSGYAWAGERHTWGSDNGLGSPTPPPHPVRLGPLDHGPQPLPQEPRRLAPGGDHRRGRGDPGTDRDLLAAGPAYLERELLDGRTWLAPR